MRLYHQVVAVARLDALGLDPLEDRAEGKFFFGVMVCLLWAMKLKRGVMLGDLPLVISRYA